MYSDVKIDSAQRITEIRENLDFIAALIPGPPTKTPRHLETSKGLVFVQLYGVIEFTIAQTISKTAQLINGESVSLQDLKPFLWGLALDSEFESLNLANRKKWDRRNYIFQKLEDNDQVTIRDTLMPTNGENYTSAQLQSIWTTFCITDPLFSDATFQWRLRDIVVNRINIAHGNSSAAEVGSRVTSAELYQRLNEVSTYCSYFISVFENYLTNKDYLK